MFINILSLVSDKKYMDNLLKLVKEIKMAPKLVYKTNQMLIQNSNIN